MYGRPRLNKWIIIINSPIHPLEAITDSSFAPHFPGIAIFLSKFSHVHVACGLAEPTLC